ncbi:conjugative transposon protein TraJ [Parapedobacter sp. ISTM3]|uniref:conjugative transposon protein TraJ n=1 Tax=Parapedobacter sp. ISTM3 TaxID=2800130 RepID=UPI0019056265|nr:conjugative transposon protein TraJ [Parapedobacter sp. ISTM3]MBK1439796.1 conjugative transposon protein TraJ [Parapedobacter sp. ISTM3]
MKAKRIIAIAAIFAVGMALPSSVRAQGLGDFIYEFNTVLDDLFNKMIPLSARLIDVGRAIAGFAALWYIAVRVWKHIARAEEIDFFPLLRPFAIGLAITFFMPLLALMNGVLKPIEMGTREMSRDSHKAILYHIQQKERELKETPPDAPYQADDTQVEKYEQPSEGGVFSGLRSAFSWFNIKSAAKQFMSEVLHVLYAAASLCINVIRTFYLIVLAIVGPLVFGLSVFDGFQNTLANWFARYIHVYLWLPVANIFSAINSKILENLMNLDQGFMSSTAYLIFMVISIVGYTTIPNVAGYIVQAGGNDTLLHKINQMTQQAGKAAAALI